MSLSDAPTQERLVELATAFNLAALKKQSDPIFELRLLDVMEYVDIRAMQRLSEKIRDLKRRLGEDAEGNRIYARAVFELTEKISELYEKFCREDEFDDMIPTDARIKAVNDAFERRGLKAFARIARPNLNL